MTGLAARIVPDLCESGGLYEHGGMGRREMLAEWPGVVPDAAIGEAGWWPAGEAETAEATVYARAQRAVGRLLGEHLAANQTVIVVTHGRFCGVFISAMLGLGPAGYTRFPMENCALSRVDFQAFADVAAYPPPDPAHAPDEITAVRLRFHNRTEHIPADRVT